MAADRLTWLGQTRWTADEALNGGVALSSSGRPRDLARAFLQTCLQDGPRTLAEVWSAALDHGHSRRTLFRARKELGIRLERTDVDGLPVDYLLLPDQCLPAPEDPEADLEPWLAPLRARYPPTPVEDL